MKWPFKKQKRHLRYKSVWEWAKAESVPPDFIAHPDPTQRNQWITEYGELRQHLFDQHVKTLPLEEQKLFDEQAHPSSSHRLGHEAKPYLDTLRQELDAIGIRYVECVLGYYHGDRIILSVTLEDDGKTKPEDLPWLHRGFEIKFYGKNISQMTPNRIPQAFT